MAVNLIEWGATNVVTAALIGLEETVPGDMHSYTPVWVCGNFSLQANVSSLDADTGLVKELKNRWDNVLTDQGALGAEYYGVSTVSGSNDFTFPLLAAEVLISVELAAVISVSGFIFLLVVFTGADGSLSVVGTVSMVSILVLSFYCHLQFVTDTVDLLDIVVLIAITGMVVDFPCHVIMEYQHSTATATATTTTTNTTGDGTVAQSKPGVCACAVAWLPEPLVRSSAYISRALIAPLILTVIAGIPLLFATFQLLRKTGQYMIILGIVSYAYCITVLPLLLSLELFLKRRPAVPNA